MASQRCLHLNPQIYEYVILCGKRDFAGVTKLRILRWGDCFGLSRWAQYITRVLPQRRQEVQSQREICDAGSRDRSDKVTNGGVQAASGSREKVRSRFSSRTSARNTAMLTPWFSPHKGHFRRLTSRAVC